MPVDADDQAPMRDGANNLQNYGGRPQVIREFEVQEHEVTNQPQDGGSWNNDMDNPLGPP